MRYVNILVCAALVLAGCRTAAAPRPALVSVRITVVPANGGSAEFEVNRDGSVRGGHLSGDSVPFVHQDEGRLDRLAVDSLWRMAEALDSATATASPPSGRGYAALQLSFAGGSAWLTSWPDSSQPGDARVLATVDWLLAHRIGGW